jgi:hypothetical protein
MTAPLFALPPKLTDKQQAVYQLCNNDGATAPEIGAHLHQQKNCPWCRLAGEWGGCDYANQDARSVLYALRKKGLVVRRRATGQWQQIGSKPARTDTGAQTDTFPEGF